MTGSGDRAVPPLLTTLLDAAGRGDRDSFDRAFSLLYDELSALARSQRRKWQGNATMSTSVLVHEAYLKLLGGAESARWEGRRHFFALAAQVMRQVLVNYAEAQRAAKRGGEAERVPLEDVMMGSRSSRCTRRCSVWPRRTSVRRALWSADSSLVCRFLKRRRR